MPNKAFEKPPGEPDGRKRRGKRTVKNSSTAPRKIMITAAFRKKAEEAIQYRLLGYTYGQIGEALKCDPSYAYRLVKWSMDRRPVEGADEVRNMMTARLEAMMSAVMDNAINSGDGEAQEHARKNIDLICRLNGLFRPVKVEHSGEVEGGGTTVFIISETDARC